MSNRTQLHLPINIVTIFQLITVFLFFFGPIERELINPVLVFAYLIVVIFVFRFGYFSYFRGRKGYILYENNYLYDNEQKEDNFKDCIFYLISCIYVVVSVLILVSRTGGFNLSLSSFSNLGAAYYERGSTNLSLERIIIFSAPITATYIPYGMISWKKLNFFQKIVYILSIFFRAMVDMVQGINKSFADIVIFLMIYGIFLYAKSTIHLEDGTRKFKKRIIKIGFIVGIIFVVFLMFFSMNIMSRTAFELNQRKSGIDYFISYITEGYKAVDFSFTQPFESTFGLGNSMYTLRIINSDFLFSRSYVIKNQAQYGWNYLSSWSSLYVWLGNDVSMLGVIPVMYILGRIFSKSWVESLIDKKNLSSLIIVGLMFQLALYSSANNQIVQNQTDFVATWFWLIYWFLHKRVKFTFGRKK